MGDDMGVISTWFRQHPPDKALWSDLARWDKANEEPESAVVLLEELEQWLQHRAGPTPDLVALIAHYGHVRLLLQDWKLPIDVPESDYDAWRAEYRHMTLSDFQDRLAEVAGGFMELGGHDPQLTLRILQEHLSKKLARLERLADLPVSEYTPQFTKEALETRYRAEGLTGRTLELVIGEHMADSDGFDEEKKFNEPFALREELDSFEWGMEKFRLFAISEHEPEIGLPNKELYEALMQIDLNGLIARLEQIDVRLRRIWQHLAKHNYYNLNVAYEPEQFWWRHWKKHDQKK